MAVPGLRIRLTVSSVGKEMQNLQSLFLVTVRHTT